MPKVNHEILRWARKTSGLELDKAAKKIGLRQTKDTSAVDRLKELESGKADPSRPLLLRMSKQYHRPLVVFYMSNVPRKGDRGKDFRTLPADYTEVDDVLIDVLLRNIHARQNMFRSVLEEDDDIKPLPFVGSASIEDDIQSLTSDMYKVLDFNIEEFRAQSSPHEAFNLLRTKAEAAGVFVLLIGNLGNYHTNIDINNFRGLALADNIAPFVIINDNDSRAAWSFTLLHELVHIWLGETGISGINAGKSIEKFCNDVAGTLLLTTEELNNLDLEESESVEIVQKIISEFAQSRNVSSSMVAYKLYLADRISLNLWEKLSSAFRELWLYNRNLQRTKLREKEGGPNYYVVRRHRLGSALINQVRQFMESGAMTTSKAGKVLGVKSKKVQALLETSQSSFGAR